MQDILDTITPKWYKDPGASNKEISQLKAQLKFNLPTDYELFLAWSNGGEGWLGSNYFSLWNCEQVIRRNISAKIDYYLPHVLGIGTDGGDDCYALNYTEADNTPSFVRVPLGDLDITSCVTIGNTFLEGLRKLISS